jgi:ribosomal protein S18 acetylase RimI-like enzyme
VADITMPVGPGTEEIPFTLRPLVAADLEAVAALHFRCFRIQSSRRFVARAYYPTFLAPRSTGIGVVATHAGGFAGFVVGALDETAFHRTLVRRHPVASLLALAGKAARLRLWEPAGIGSGGACVHYLATAPGARRLGLGRRLLQALLDRLSAAGAPTCFCRIYDTNIVNRRLNESLGARRIGGGRDRLGPYGNYRFDLAQSTGAPGSAP